MKSCARYEKTVLGSMLLIKPSYVADSSFGEVCAGPVTLLSARSCILGDRLLVMYSHPEI